MAARARDAFFRILNRELRSVLEGAGFGGGKTDYTRVSGEVIQALSLNVDKNGGGCAVELGVHPELLPRDFVDGDGILQWDRVRDPGQLKESHCAFRWRLKKPGEADTWWWYGTPSSPVRDVEAVARDLVSTVGAIALPSLDALAGVDAIADELTPQRIEAKDLPWMATLARTAIAMARIELRRGNRPRAREHAEIALRHLGAGALLRPTIEDLLEQTSG